MVAISKIANDMLAKSHPHPDKNPVLKASAKAGPDLPAQAQLTNIIKALSAAIKAEPDPMDQAQLAKALLIVKQIYAKEGTATG